MLKINIPTSPFPLWEHIVRSKRDILFITLESFTNSILSKLRFSSLRKFMLCICKKNYFSGDANVKSQKGMILAGELQFYQFLIGISLLTPCCKRGNPTKGVTSIQHPPMLRLSITISRCNTLSVPKKNGERGTSWEQMWASRNNLCSRTNIQAFCKVKRKYFVLIILETFFEVRPVNHLKQFIVENEGFIFLHDEIFLDLRIENKIKSWSLQVRCNSADWKKEALKT